VAELKQILGNAAGQWKIVLRREGKLLTVQARG
jgi:hypothetical protein